MGWKASEGAIVNDRFRLLRRLGEGTMGAVFAAEDLRLGHTVALKFIHDPPSEKSRRELLAEARATAALRGDHVVRVFDVSEVPGAAVFLVMEMLPGETLRERLGRTPVRPPVEEAIGYAIEACAGAAEVHAAGRVHRDIKPANLFLEQRPDGTVRVKLCDFGFAQGATPSELAHASTAKPAMVIGTPLYMAPEQIDAPDSVDARADVWSIGALLYELLAGAPPFAAPSILGVLSAIATRDPAPLAKWRADLPDGLDEVVRRCLVRDRAARTADVAALALELARFAGLRHRALAVATARVLMLPRLRGALDAHDFEAVIERGEALLALDGALGDVRKLVADALLTRARARLDAGDLQAARQDATRAVELDGERREGHALRARLDARLGQLKDFVHDYIEERLRDPLDARMSLIDALGRGEDARAFEIMSSMIASGTADALTLYHRGLMHYQQDRVAEALADLDASLAMDDTNAAALAYRGAAHARLGHRESALADAEAAIRLAPRPFFYMMRAVARRDLGDLEEALAEMLALDGKVPESLEYLDERAKLYELLGDVARAAADRAEAQRKRDRNAEWERKMRGR